MENKPCRKFSIRAKLVIALLLLAFVPLSIGGTCGVYYSIWSLEETTLKHLEQEVLSKGKDIERFLLTVHKDVLYLSQSMGVKDLVDSGESRGTTGFSHLQERVGKEFMAFSKTHPYYYQIRYIDERGYEVVRVDSDGRSSSLISPGMLQFKGDRYYFTEAMKYREGLCYVSPMDLNIEWGRVELPHRPVVRVATPVLDSTGKKRGIIIINIFGSYFVEQVKMMNIAKGGVISLVNREGFYLSRLNSGKGFFLLDSLEEVKKDYPEEIVAKILGGKAGTFSVRSRIVSYAPIPTGDQLSKDYWILVEEYPKSLIFAPLFRLQMVYFILGAISILASIAVGIWLARRLTKPILELYRGVDCIANEDFDYRINIRTGDEIEGLSERVNNMAERLNEAREKILRWNEELKEEVRKRTIEIELSHNELMVERNKLESILMCAREGIVVADETDRVIMVNPATEQILGLKESDMTGRDIFSLHEDLKPVMANIKNLQRPLSLATARVGEKIVAVTLSAITMGDKRIGSMIVMRDITERERLIESQRQMEKQLYQADKMASVGELSVGIAHEIGNPLAAIKTVIQAMEEVCPLKGPQRKYMTRIIKEVDRLTAFIRTFSTFAHPSTRQSQTCQIDRVLKDVLFLLQKEAVKLGIAIEEAVEAGMPPVRIDPQQMQQVLINLLLNAIQAMPEGGRIEIAAGCNHEDEEGGDFVKISISDTGCGIPLEHRDKIYNPFFTTKPTGTGLGLSIVHRIITEHNGKITVSSVVGKGTTFDIFLPLLKPSPPVEVSFRQEQKANSIKEET